MAWLLVAVVVVAAAGLAWGLFEAQWVEYLERDAPVQGLPPELDGFRILHISDFHLGTVSLNGRALRKAVDWAAPQELDLVAVTGDLVSRQRGVRHADARARRGSARATATYAVLGNHDVASTRDPFSRPADLSEVDAAVLLEHESVALEHVGRRVQVAGGDPRRLREPHGPLADPDADLRILLVHFPDPVRTLAPGEFHLILAGHLHGGQICIPDAARQGAARAPARAVLGGPLRAAGGDAPRLPRARARASSPSGSWPGRRRRSSRCEPRSRLAAGMAYRLSPVTRASIGDAPAVCVDCVFWQSRGGRSVEKERWAERVEDDWGAWGTLYQAEGDRLVGFVQYGPSGQFPRGAELPAGPAVARCRARHVRLPRRPLHAVGAAEPLPGGHRRRARPRRQGDRDVRLPLPGGRDELRARARPPHGVPGGLPGGLRLHGAALAGRRRAWRGSSSAGSCRWRTG